MTSRCALKSIFRWKIDRKINLNIGLNIDLKKTFKRAYKCLKTFFKKKTFKKT